MGLDPLLPGSVAIGLAAGYATRGRLSGVVDRILMPNVLALVAVMGVSAGARLGESGLADLVYGSLAVALIPSMASLAAAVILAGKGSPGRGHAPGPKASGPWHSVASLLAGLGLGYASGAEPPGILVDVLLYLLLALSGYSVGGMKGLREALSAGGRRGALLALSCIVGGVVGGVIVSLIMGWSLGVGVAMGIASGWYSLVGPLLLLVDPLYGAAAFLGNLFREILHIATYPILSRSMPMAAVAVGGATTMDTGLPVVAAYGGPEERVAAFIQGAILTVGLSIGLPAYVALLA